MSSGLGLPGTASLAAPERERGSLVEGVVARTDGKGLVWVVIPTFHPHYEVGPMVSSEAVGASVLLARSRSGEWWVAAPSRGAGEQLSDHGIWRWTTATGAPASGRVGIDAASWSAAAHLNLSETTAPGTDVSTVLGAITTGTDFYVQQQDDATRWARYTTTGA